MTTPPEEIEVKCPGCGQTYKTWHRASINFDLGETWTDEAVEKATTAICPACGLKVALSTLFVKDKTFIFT